MFLIDAIKPNFNLEKKLKTRFPFLRDYLWEG